LNTIPMNSPIANQNHKKNWKWFHFLQQKKKPTIHKNILTVNVLLFFFLEKNYYCIY
jgi:hypothetical protein